jgi:integrase
MARELTTGDLPRSRPLPQWVRDVGLEAGVPVRTHLLRHTALAEANDRSGNLRAVQDLARHSRPETTAGYTRTTAARLKSVVAMIDYGRGAA